jgi:hypothetical protein
MVIRKAPSGCHASIIGQSVQNNFSEHLTGVPMAYSGSVTIDAGGGRVIVIDAFSIKDIS